MTQIFEHYPAKRTARVMAKLIISKDVNFFIPNYRYMPHLVLSYLPRTVKSIIVVHNDTEEVYQLISFYRSAIDGVIYPSNAAFLKSNLKIPKKLKKALIPHYFLPLGDPYQRSESKNKLLLVYHGRVAHVQKKSMELLNIAKQLNLLQVPFTLKIIGMGNALSDIKDRIKEESIDNIDIVGPLSRDQLYEHIKDADIALSTSTYEGFCYSVAEALSLGIVPVAYENDVLRDLIKNEENGYLLPWGRADLVALRIQRLYEYPQIKKIMSNAAIESVKGLLSSKRYAIEMSSFFNSLKGAPVGKSWPLLRPRGLPYDTLLSRLIARGGKKIKLW